MATEFKTVYLKIAVKIMTPIERIADSQHRTTSAQIAMILEGWLENLAGRQGLSKTDPTLAAISDWRKS